MSITKTGRSARKAVVSRATWGGSQNFLGARWVEHLVGAAPDWCRESVALRFLSLSPHYFYDRNICAEAERNKRSRAALAEAIIAPYLSPESRVLDYGCGPGYLALAVADRAAHVTAVDISRGVLACAKALNARPNISYQTPDELGNGAIMADVAYSFAVFQHMRMPAARDALALIARNLHPKGILLLHFAEPGAVGWKTEAEWLSDSSLASRAKLRYGLNCFGRSAAEMIQLVSSNDFDEVIVTRLGETIDLPDDDLARQHLLTARRK
jgi:2-polyprenyl-3-methyl-5-hydroxy-6-metoxy-1,4-benzoquinol methylase